MRLPLRKQRYASAVVPIREGFLYRKQNQRIALVMYPGGGPAIGRWSEAEPPLSTRN
jgi:hypothetical protein